MIPARSGVAAFLAPLMFVGCDQLAERPAVQPVADATITLHPFFRDLRTVDVIVRQDTLTLLFDTGGGATLITPDVAMRLGCRPFGRDVGHRMTGEAVEFQRCDSLTFAAAGSSRRLAPVAVFDVNALLPKELPRLDGVLSLDAFRGQVLTLDWPNNRVIVHSARRGDGAIAESGVPVRLATGETGRMLTAFVKTGARRGELWLLLDSGNLRGTLLDGHVARDSLLVTGADSLVELRIGGRAPIRVAAQFATLILDGALGTDYLRRGPVTLDLRGTLP